jgi:fermentation-respiration switch protein FrsA (DUF1100 family)
MIAPKISCHRCLSSLGGVKEQASGLYAQLLAKRGFITLAYDASHYGESGGMPRDLENPADRVQDIRSAVGYLSSLPQVDAAHIGALVSAPERATPFMKPRAICV